MHETQIGPPVTVNIGDSDILRLEGRDIWDDDSDGVKLKENAVSHCLLKKLE